MHNHVWGCAEILPQVICFVFWTFCFTSCLLGKSREFSELIAKPNN